MYIPEIVVGIFGTIIAELALIVIAAVIISIKDKKGRKK